MYCIVFSIEFIPSFVLSSVVARVGVELVWCSGYFRWRSIVVSGLQKLSVVSWPYLSVWIFSSSLGEFQIST